MAGKLLVIGLIITNENYNLIITDEIVALCN